ncbi:MULTISPECIES: hypothetical protein [unclassified Rhizobium]|uniref:hypothetical protein n=1 Tax=unclassified Rhizobium TaxID=2613769 RepID=UPI0007E9E87C|nr:MULTISPECIES: hypothetical protein [unclassified Rhizobium]ANM11304.1 hypothetical protein AMK05_CH02935 [Rhizobium sp. N324]OYD04905.1 hypothetical protein AMK08_CH102952 [Rhizobium sp. N4311]
MKLENLDDIWGDLRGLSNRDKAVAHGRRGQEALDAARASGRLEADEKGVKRGWLADLLGVGRSALRQNTALRRITAEFDELASELFVSHQVRVADIEKGLDGPQSNVIDLVETKARLDRLDTGEIEFVTFEFDGETYTIPVLLWGDRIDEDASDFLRDRVVKDGVSLLTAKRDASILRRFLRHCRKKGWQLRHLTDGRLRNYRSSIRHVDAAILNDEGRNIWARTFNNYLSVIFRFLTWAEKTGRIRGVVELDQAQSQRQRPPVTGRVHYGVMPSGRRIRQWVSIVTLRDKRGNAADRGTPDEPGIRNVHRVAASHRHATRDTLLFLWGEYTGARRASVLGVRLTDLPTREQLDELRSRGSRWGIKIFTKGGTWHTIYPDLFLLDVTLDYVDVERAAIVEVNLKKGRPPSQFVFLSQKTGEVLQGDSLTKISIECFRKAGIFDCSYHRFRATYVTKKICVALDAYGSTIQGLSPNSSFIETLVTRVHKDTNHLSPEGLKPYIGRELDRRLRRGKEFKSQELDGEIRQKELHLETTNRRLTKSEEKRQLLRDIDRGDRASAEARLAVLV